MAYYVGGTGNFWNFGNSFDYADLIRRQTSGRTGGGSVSPVVASDPRIIGINLDNLANATYGETMPMFVGGIARIGGHIVYGPYLSGNYASFGISFGVPANVDGTRTLYEISFDGQVAWDLSSGFSNGDSFDYEFKQGTLTQTVSSLESARFGSLAVAYRPQMMLFFDNLPLEAFGDKIPYVAAVIGDTTGGADPTDGINLGAAIERLAWSAWGGYTEDTFDAQDITDVVGALLIDSDLTIVKLCQGLSQFYRNLDLVQRDKLILFDHGDLTTPDLILTPDRIMTAERPVVVARSGSADQSRELELVTIDKDADYTWVPSRASRPRYPVLVSGAAGKSTQQLPIVTDAATRVSLVNYSQYASEVARKTVSFTTMPYGYEVEPGDRVALVDLGDGFDDDIYKVTDTLHAPNGVVQCTAEAIMLCQFSADDEFDDSIAVGYSDGTGMDNASHTVRVYEPGGTLRWGATEPDQIWEVCRDADGNVFGFGVELGATAAENQSNVWKWSSSGLLLWTAPILSGTHANIEEMGGFACDPDGDVFLSYSDDGANMHLLKLDGDIGAVLLDVPFSGFDWGYFCDRSGNLYGANRDDQTVFKRNSSGSLVWSIPTVNAREAVPITDRADGVYFIDSGHLRKVSSLSGDDVWSVDLGGTGSHVFAQLGTDGVNIYAIGGASDTSIVKVDSSGTILWTQTVGAAVNWIAGDVYAAAYDTNHLYKLNKDTGSLEWTLTNSEPDASHGPFSIAQVPRFVL